MSPSTPPTEYKGLANSLGVTKGAYSGVATKDEATHSGDYQKTNEGLKTPFRLPYYRPPEVRRLI